MNILNIIEEGRFGGPQKRVSEVSYYLNKQGVSTVVVFPNSDAEKTKSALARLGVSFRAIRLHRLTKDIFHLFGYFVFFIPEILSIKKIIQDEKIDIVHCNGSWQIKGIVAAKISGVKSVWHLNDSYVPGYILKLFCFIANNFASNYIFASEKTKQFYFGGEEASIDGIIKTIQAPVDTNTLHPGKYNKQIFSHYNGINILTIGNIVPVKGHFTLVEMVNWLSNNSDLELNFFIAGSEWENQKPYILSLKEKISKYGLKNIHFLGSRSDIPDLLDSADFYICSSEYEASPISIWEAMSMGKAIISTDVGDVKDIFFTHDCGVTVDTKDYLNMAKALLHLIKDKTMRVHYEQNARKAAKKLLDIEICVEKHHEIYTKIL